MSSAINDIAKRIYDHARSEGASHEEAIERTLKAIVAFSPHSSPDSVEETASFLRAQKHVQLPPTVMQGDIPFLAWFQPEMKPAWTRWQRYRRYLLDEKLWDFDSVAALDESSDQIVGQLGDPRASEAFDRRGLVVGSVQSGKTASYMALMAKAADAGYRVIIVLAGIHNNLRHQTQTRIDEEIVGVGTDLGSMQKHRVGVGLLEPQDQHPPMNYLTGRGEHGDFSVQIAQKVGVHVGQTPLLLVVKKNVRVLEHLIKYLRGLPETVSGDGGIRQIRGVPLLLVDDEADQASVNFRPVRDGDDQVDNSLDPSRVNEQIRKLLVTFSHRTYVGYTATPFANVLIPHEGLHPKLGPDLFPRDFIVALHPPDNYVGPKQVFGAGTRGDGSGESGMPVVRVVGDHEAFLPEPHRQDQVPGPMPPTLREALLAYLLAGAARICRGQERKHHTMLVHVTRYTAVQRLVDNHVKRALQRLRSILEYNSGAPGTPESRESLLTEFHSLWERDFVPTSAAMDTPLPPWEDVAPYLLTGLRRVTTKIINGEAADVLDYEQHAKDGAWVIVVGGDKLSRGLTLEGLSVSYYLRASRTYDTLMQMGRWFGYRQGYSDLCRVYTTAELVTWFQHIVIATEALWDEFEMMQRLGSSPQQFGLRIIAHPSIEVTSPIKMREAERISLNYSGTIQETIMFDLADHIVQANQACIDDLIGQLGDPDTKATENGPVLWAGIPAGTVVEFMRAFTTHPEALTVISSRMADYIEQHIPKGLLMTWTVALMSAKMPVAGTGTGVAGGHRVNRFQRTPAAASTAGCTRIKRLLSPDDELLDLDENEHSKLARNRPGKTLRDPVSGQDARGYDIKSPRVMRIGRPPSRGFMIIYPLVLGSRGIDATQSSTVWGLALSFPRSERLLDHEFIANTVLLSQMRERNPEPSTDLSLPSERSRLLSIAARLQTHPSSQSRAIAALLTICAKEGRVHLSDGRRLARELGLDDDTEIGLLGRLTWAEFGGLEMSFIDRSDQEPNGISADELLVRIESLKGDKDALEQWMRAVEVLWMSPASTHN